MIDDEGIPADISLLLDFANTLDERSFTRHGRTHGGGDELASTATAQRWLAEHDLLATGGRLPAGGLAKLVTLRNGLRWALAAKAGAHTDPAAPNDTNAGLTQIPLVLQFGQHGQPQLTPGKRAAVAAAALLASEIVSTAARGSWHRLRMCAAPDCRWIFYDTSRRGGGRWCSMAVCGNRVKTRRYRQRHAQAAAK